MKVATFTQKALKRAIVKRSARTAILKDSRAFERLQKELMAAMTRAWSDQMRKGIADALDRLRDLGAGAFTQADAASILAIMEDAVGGAAIAATLREPVINLSDGIARAGAGEVGTALSVDIVFNRADLDALDLIKRGNVLPVANSWDSVTRDRINPILVDYFTDGLTRDQLTQRFASDFAEMTEKGRVYWETVADNVATRTREMGRITGYERAGVEFVQVRAQLDDNTSAICRDLNGRIIAVAKLAAQRSAYLDAVAREDTSAANEAWTMHGASTDFSTTRTNALPAATGSPPYHFKCRTITVVYFPSDDVIENTRAALVNRDPISIENARAIRSAANKADWPNARVFQSHYDKHGSTVGTNNIDAYQRSAKAVIASPDSQMRLTTRRDRKTNDSKLIAIFTERSQSPSGRHSGYKITAVDVDDGTITTHHYRKKLGDGGNDLPSRIVREKGLIMRSLQKWLIN